MKRLLIIFCLTVVFTSPLIALPGWARADGLVTKFILYIPNRVCDVFDLVRARVRAGPGFAVVMKVSNLPLTLANNM